VFIARDEGLGGASSEDGATNTAKSGRDVGSTLDALRSKLIEAAAAQLRSRRG
jgi:hypothetical protein